MSKKSVVFGVFVFVYTYNYMSLFMSIHTYFLFVYTILHLFKIRLCCFLDMHLFSNNLSTIAIISSLIMSELFPACFSCSNNFNLSDNSSGFFGRNNFLRKISLKQLKQKPFNLVI